MNNYGVARESNLKNWTTHLVFVGATHLVFVGATHLVFVGATHLVAL
jgi:hypothetical protein